MKNKNLWLVALAVVAGALQSCDNNKTYAEYKEEEDDAIDAWILKHDYEVISEKQFYAQDTMTQANQFVKFESSGVYMNIQNKGNGRQVLTDGSYSVLSRYIEIAMQTRQDMFNLGDTLTANVSLQNFPKFFDQQNNWSLPDYMLQPDEYKLTVSGTSYSASFQTSVMYALYSQYSSAYATSAVPAGWLVPLQYIKPGRTQSADEVARVRLIVPSEQGTKMASQYVFPCYYEITYNLGR